VLDIPLQVTPPTLLNAAVGFSDYQIRVEGVSLVFNFTVPVKTITTDKVIVVQLSEGFGVPSQRIRNLQCRLLRINDDTAFVFEFVDTLELHLIVPVRLRSTNPGRLAV
jgi:hypothetical protein